MPVPRRYYSMRKLIILSVFVCVATACKKEQTNPTFIFKEEPTNETVVINVFPLKEGNQWTYTTDLQVYREANSVLVNSPYTLTCGAYGNGPIKTYQLRGSLKKFFKYPLSSGYLMKHNGTLYITQNPAIDSAMLTDSATCLLPKHITPYEQTDYKKPVTCRVIPVGYVKVTTPLGSFTCIKIQTEYFDGPITVLPEACIIIPQKA